MSFAHEPMRPPRRETLGEQVFYRRWQALMATHPYDDPDLADRTWLDVILYDLYEKTTQRHAVVAASLVVWLGSNGGLELIMKAGEDLRSTKGCASVSWVRAWSVNNRRLRGVNHAVRTLEHLLSPAENISLDGSLAVFPELSADDYEVAEHLCAWFGSYHGGKFIREAEEELSVLKAAAHFKCGRIEPIPNDQGVVAVWNTPDHSRDREMLCAGGMQLGGWEPLEDGQIKGFLNRLGAPQSQRIFVDPNEAKAWVEPLALSMLAALGSGVAQAAQSA